MRLISFFLCGMCDEATLYIASMDVFTAISEMWLVCGVICKYMY